MEKFDGRNLDHRTREQIRIRAVKRVEAVERPEVVIKALGFNIYQRIAVFVKTVDAWM